LSNFKLPNIFDVLVVGSGAAGLYTALCLPSHYQVGLLSKEPLSLSASEWAQGGMAAAISPDDSPALHIEDTLKAGAGLCELDAVKFLAEKAPACVDRLMQMGVAFDRNGPDLALTLEAAHSRRRVLHAADTTGRAVVTTLKAQVLNRPNIQAIFPAFILSLWLHPETQQCQGVCVVYEGHVSWIRARAVIIATGGGGQVFSQTTNPSCSTGDGVAMAWRSGALLRDLEFFQFHPTALTCPGAPRFLISEAVRGEGAHLVDGNGQRFVFDYDPAGELAPRDIVSRAIFSHLQKASQKSDVPIPQNVWLDLRPIPDERIRYRFPNIIQVCQKWGIDVFSQPIPVAPAAHYWMGGIVADTENKTSIVGLYAVGETASTGVHGANRLASNSLLECLVFGGEMEYLKLPALVEPFSHKALSQPVLLGDFDPLELSEIKALREELPLLLWRYAGICRDGEGLEMAITQVEKWRDQFKKLSFSDAIYSLLPGETLKLKNPDEEYQYLQLWGETWNLLDIAYLILKSALFRTESRGGHFRTDHPSSDTLAYHTLVNGGQFLSRSIGSQRRQ
jgi:L-aspartate oxidase